MDSWSESETGMPSESIVLGIAKRSDTDITELPPLYNSIDAEALDTIVQADSSCRVSFQYAGYDVTVDGPHSIAINAVTSDQEGNAVPEASQLEADTDD